MNFSFYTIRSSLTLSPEVFRVSSGGGRFEIDVKELRDNEIKTVNMRGDQLDYRGDLLDSQVELSNIERDHLNFRRKFRNTEWGLLNS